MYVPCGSRKLPPIPLNHLLNHTSPRCGIHDIWADSNSVDIHQSLHTCGVQSGSYLPSRTVPLLLTSCHKALSSRWELIVIWDHSVSHYISSDIQDVQSGPYNGQGTTIYRANPNSFMITPHVCLNIITKSDLKKGHHTAISYRKLFERTF